MVPPPDLPRVAIYGASAALSMSNMRFAAQGGYFDTPSDPSPNPISFAVGGGAVLSRVAAGAARREPPPPAPEGAPLDLRPSGSCTRVERVRRADDRPIAHQVTHIPAELGSGIEEALTAHGSLYEFLRDVHGLEVDSAD